MQHSEALCGATDAKHYMREREVEHSVTLDLLPPPLEHLVPCRSVLTATGSNGFIVRLHRSKSQNKHSSAASSRNMDSSMSVRNSTNSCPLSIVSTLHFLFTFALYEYTSEEEGVFFSVVHEDIENAQCFIIINKNII